LNGTVFADGFIKGGRQGAVDALHDFWKAVSDSAMKAPGQVFANWLMGGGNGWNVDQSPAFVMADYLSRMFSPYQFNPTDYNPLKEILAAQVDFEGLRRRKEIKLFVAATNVSHRPSTLCVPAA